MNSFDPFATVGGMLIFFFLLFLGICTLLMPIFVVAIHSTLKKIEKLNKQMDERMHQLVWYAKQKHDREG